MPSDSQTNDIEVRQAIEANGIRSWMLRRCSMCGWPLVYRFAGERVTFDSNCGCVSWWRPPQESSYQDVAETLNMQVPEARTRMWRSLLGGEHHDG